MVDPTPQLEALRRSPLAHLTDALAAGSGDAVALAEEPFLTMVSVRVGPGSAAAGRIGRILDLELPRRCGEVAAMGRHAALWLGPDEWLVVSTATPVALADQLETALGADRGQVVDVSANRTTLALTGERAREVLEKACPADLHPRAFGPGSAVTTTLARIPVLLWQTGPAAYRILPRSSFADYVARWLLDAMREYAGAQAR
ncbi:sarcosine oxidase subunit gamma [Nonomuraea sp. NEAU-A123]|uniref:sarcosine oxidase subunit gamma n=1 Tax=Nonomuraea sp. NEAU-A123 TaxID=2839649 RepID=UPI001BE4D8AC|nr:sarcosine oxidase subunit gamma family protein [Nonomuraea sp. NEAU-A123]MBT2228376.1 sarcosine oxidase subunit gamma [Nonomuraea sp. NEAU-A123]